MRALSSSRPSLAKPWRRPITRGLMGLLALVALLWSAPARAETWGQYLVIIDDSGSMKGNDPKRLVMLASLALSAGLSDADQIMITGLNELSGGPAIRPRFVSPRELLVGRDGGEGVRGLAGPSFDRMAQQGGGTPCATALARAAALLEEVASAGAPQTLLLLTDGACDGTIEPAATWLGRLSSHADGRFRFALLTMKHSRERLEPALVEYALATGWTADPSVSFDSRSLLRAFAEVLSFSRGLRYDDGGRVGLERSFAGAREVRVLAVSSEGKAPISLTAAGLELQTGAVTEAAILGGPTFKHEAYDWSLRVAKTGARDQPFAARSPDPGVEVLVIPSYGLLRLEAIVGPCADAPGASAEAGRPPLPWTRERAVRSGQAACAWARLVGDLGETIHPAHSLKFEIELCGDANCKVSTAMQPDLDGTFNAQLGIISEGRSDRWFRAQGGALATPITIRRALQSVAFGISSVVRTDQRDKPIDGIDLGLMPAALPKVFTLEYAGSFPDGGEAQVRCVLAGDAKGSAAQPLARELPCLRCTPTPTTVTLQDPFTVQVEVVATGLCPLVSEAIGELPVALDLIVEASGAAQTVGTRRLPLTTRLRHAVITVQALELKGGEQSSARLRFPAPVNSTVSLVLEPSLVPTPGGGQDPPNAKELQVVLEQTELRVSGEPGDEAEVGVSLRASDCCTTGTHAFSLRVSDAAGGPALTVPVTITVTKPSFWTCPGKLLASWAAALFGVGLLIWLIRGFTSPQNFAATAVLARAESHAALAKLGEGDEDWRLVRSLEPTKRGFYRPATVHLGGPKAALPSLRELSSDARIEARAHANATLVVEAEGIETFKESTGWTPVPVGELPIGSSLVLRRDTTYLLFRR